MDALQQEGRNLHSCLQCLPRPGWYYGPGLANWTIPMQQWLRTKRYQDLPLSADCRRNNMCTVPTILSQQAQCYWENDPDHHQDGLSNYDWLPSTCLALGRSNKRCGLPPAAISKQRADETRWLWRLQCTIPNSIQDAPCIWQSCSQHCWQQDIIQGCKWSPATIQLLCEQDHPQSPELK